VKVGETGPVDFAWFPNVLPGRKLLVIGASEFRSTAVKGVTLEQFLLSDGFPHPYPGPVEDPDVYNEHARF
jgi:hypothetical protein